MVAKVTNTGRGGGQVVSKHALYYNDLSLNPRDTSRFFLLNLCMKRTKIEADVGPLKSN